jgi:hypothetical protein
MMSTNNKRDMEASENDDEDYKDGSSLHNALLRKMRMLCQRCVENERLLKRLEMELRLSKSHASKQKVRQGLITIGMARRLILLTQF